MLHRFRRPAIPASKLARLIASANKAACGGVLIDTAVSEFCFYIEGGASTATLDDKVLSWLLSETYEPADFAAVTFFDEVSDIGEGYVHAAQLTHCALSHALSLPSPPSLRNFLATLL